MDSYDVVIVGGGPAGLRAAERLAGGGKRVVLFEARPVIGAKVCAGGLTRKCVGLGLPDHLLTRGYRRIRLRTRRVVREYEDPSPMLYTCSREALGQWQAEAASRAGAELVWGTTVSGLAPDHVILQGGSRVGFRWLIGADGARSLVRRTLGLPASRMLNCIQYDIPAEAELPEIHFDRRHFGSWLLWSFPHDGRTRVGTGSHGAITATGGMRNRLDNWLASQGISREEARLEGAPIAIDYCGIRHGEQRFLLGDAAGLAFDYNGEGIYSALVSADEAARAILHRGYEPDLRGLLRTKRAQCRLLELFSLGGIFTDLLYRWLVSAPARKFWHRRLTDLVL